MLIVVFWVLKPSRLAGDSQRFGGKNRLHLQSTGDDKNFAFAGAPSRSQ
jgi:hypothetical protein